MVIIWRGWGIMVFLMFVIVGLITTIWFDGWETKIVGNTEYLSWVLTISGVLLIPIGISTWKGKIVQDIGIPAHRKKHDFFWIPIIFWAIFYLGLGIYMMFFVEYNPNTNSSYNSPVNVITEPTTRVINLYNPSQDTIKIIVQDELRKTKIVYNENIAPNRITPVEFGKGTYMFHSWSPQGEKIAGFMPEESILDSSKFKLHRDDLGTFYQRILNPSTIDTSDYDEAWLVIDGKTKLALVSINKIVESVIKVENIDKLTDQDIIKIYSPDDLIDPIIGADQKGINTIVVSPSEDILPRKNKKDNHYALIPFTQDKFTIEIAKDYLRDTKF